MENCNFYSHETTKEGSLSALRIARRFISSRRWRDVYKSAREGSAITKRSWSLRYWKATSYAAADHKPWRVWIEHESCRGNNYEKWPWWAALSLKYYTTVSKDKFKREKIVSSLHRPTDKWNGNSTMACL